MDVASDKGADLLDTPLSVENYAMHLVSSVDEQSGEESTWIRTVLFLADGRTVSVGSPYLARKVLAFEETEGKAPWNPPLTVKIVARKSTKHPGGRWFTLELMS